MLKSTATDSAVAAAAAEVCASRLLQQQAATDAKHKEEIAKLVQVMCGVACKVDMLRV
jgi:tRNA G26 N,N-dimethylase Trm1